MAKRAYYERIVRPTILRAGKVMTVSNVSKFRLEEWLGHDEVEVINVGNGCSAAFKRYSNVDVEAGAPFLFVGTAKPHKNLPVVLRALKYGPALRLRVVCSDRDAVSNLVAQMGVQEQVEVLSGLSDEELVLEYNKCSALIFPSSLEGFGLPALEAVRCGKRVIYFEGCASVSEIVGVAGVPVPSVTDPGQWYEAMCMVRDMKDREIGPAEIARLTADYDWDSVSAQVAMVIESVTA
ncbi:glycosyltransferase [Arthrobacter sp. MDT2-2]